MSHHIHYRESRDYWCGFVCGLYSYEDGVRAMFDGLPTGQERRLDWVRGFRAGRQCRNYRQQ